MYNVLCQNDYIFTKIFELYQVFEPKCSSTSILYTLKHYSVKIGSISFFWSSGKQKFHHLLGCYAIVINSPLIFFSNTLRFLNLLCEAKSLIRTIVSGLSLSKLL